LSTPGYIPDAPPKAAGDELVVMGDLNKLLGASTSGMNALVAKFGLADSTAYLHGIDGDVPTYYSRSNNHLDYILYRSSAECCEGHQHDCETWFGGYVGR
jgi:endonuclease/exonuclease/phosphatase family metal-dependent hydrolase